MFCWWLGRSWEEVLKDDTSCLHRQSWSYQPVHLKVLHRSYIISNQDFLVRPWIMEGDHLSVFADCTVGVHHLGRSIRISINALKLFIMLFSSWMVKIEDYDLGDWLQRYLHASQEDGLNLDCRGEYSRFLFITIIRLPVTICIHLDIFTVWTTSFMTTRTI